MGKAKLRFGGEWSLSSLADTCLDLLPMGADVVVVSMVPSQGGDLWGGKAWGVRVSQPGTTGPTPSRNNE